MGKIDSALIRKLRDETGAPVMRVKQVLEEMLGDLPANATPKELQAGEKKASDILKREGFASVEKRAGRVTSQGMVVSYVHHSGKVASIVSLLCETDFVARNDLFKQTAHDIAMQVASMDPKDNKELLGMEFIKDPSKKISDLIGEIIAKTGENVKLEKFVRVAVGE